jgi:DNA (cytosine-5)-methyltransferase 1
MRPILLEFFAGSGAVRLAIGDDWRCTFANDHDQAKAASYIANFGAEGFRLADIADLTAADLPGQAALCWASPPCTDLSLAGRRAGLNAERSGCFWPFFRLMRALVEEGRAPTVICIENVPALLSSAGGADFTAIVEAFASLGYMTGALEVDASLFVPQSRRRLFIICARAPDIISAAVTQFGPSAPFHTVSILKAHERLSPAARVAWAWWRLPVPPPRNIALYDVLEPVRGEPDDLARILEIMAPAHRAKLETAIAARRPGEIIVGGVNRRMRDGRQVAEIRLDGLAQALRCAKGGSSIQTLLVIDDAGMHARKITPREAARLMGLPETYQLRAGIGDAHDLVGDGVAVPVVRFLSAHLLEPLAGAWRSSFDSKSPPHAQGRAYPSR